MSKKKKQNELEHLVLQVVDQYPETYVPIDLIAGVLQMSQPRERKRLTRMVERLLEHQVLRTNKSGQVKRMGADEPEAAAVPQAEPVHGKAVAGSQLEGVIEVNRHGVGFVALPGFDADVRVPRKKMGMALPGDTVRVKLLGRDGPRWEGVVTDVRKRSGRIMVGTMVRTRGVCYIEPDDSGAVTEFFVQPELSADAANGEKVSFRLIDWVHPKALPQAEVVEVLGAAGSHETLMRTILAENQIDAHFDPDVEAAAERIPWAIAPDEIRRRNDLRGERIFTIDPDDAKDFDDALSISRTDQGNWWLGVHIADVSHYVTPDSPLDREARIRATSTYLVDRVIPMLPEKLSNGVCSLRPDEDKCTYSCFMEISEHGKVLDYRIEETVIRSVRRFTYEQVQEIIDGKQDELEGEVRELHRLSKMLTAKRFKEGSVDLDTPEPRFKLDADGRPLEVTVKARLDAHRLVEECMLMANRTVAAHIEVLRTALGAKRKGKDAYPFLYRIHDRPNAEKLANIAENVRPLGIRFDVHPDKPVDPRIINQLLADIKGKALENTINELVLRSMAKAVYGPKNIGHFGLGFKHYTHFTSPIRRYPDVVVHRLLKAYGARKTAYTYPELEEIGFHCSEREKSASTAERDSIKQKQVEYLSERIGQEYDGVVTGVTEKGLFVQLKEIFCDGLVPIRTLDDDYYVHDAQRHMLIGRRRNRQFRLGDEVRVRVTETNETARTVDLALEQNRNTKKTR